MKKKLLCKQTFLVGSAKVETANCSNKLYKQLSAGRQSFSL